MMRDPYGKDWSEMSRAERQAISDRLRHAQQMIGAEADLLAKTVPVQEVIASLVVEAMGLACRTGWSQDQFLGLVVGILQRGGISITHVAVTLDDDDDGDEVRH